MEQKDCRFPKSRRIQRRRDFDAAFRDGRRLRGELMTLFLRRREADEMRLPMEHSKRDGAQEARLGVSVPRQFGGAVQRNRAKRLLREAFRLHREELLAGCDVVVVPRGDWTGLKLDPVASEFRRLLRGAAGGVSEA